MNPKQFNTEAAEIAEPLNGAESLGSLTAAQFDEVALGIMHATDCTVTKVDRLVMLTGPIGEKIACSPSLTVTDLWDTAQSLQSLFDQEQQILTTPPSALCPLC